MWRLQSCKISIFKAWQENVLENPRTFWKKTCKNFAEKPYNKSVSLVAAHGNSRARSNLRTSVGTARRKVSAPPARTVFRSASMETAWPAWRPQKSSGKNQHWGNHRRLLTCEPQFSNLLDKRGQAVSQREPKERNWNSTARRDLFGNVNNNYS